MTSLAVVALAAKSLYFAKSLYIEVWHVAEKEDGESVIFDPVNILLVYIQYLSLYHYFWVLFYPLCVLHFFWFIDKAMISMYWQGNIRLS